jgi:hypothetical protein
MTDAQILLVTLPLGEGRAIVAEIHPTACGRHSVRIARVADGRVTGQSAEFPGPRQITALVTAVERAIAAAALGEPPAPDCSGR